MNFRTKYNDLTLRTKYLETVEKSDNHAIWVHVVGYEKNKLTVESIFDVLIEELSISPFSYISIDKERQIFSAKKPLDKEVFIENVHSVIEKYINKFDNQYERNAECYLEITGNDGKTETTPVYDNIRAARSYNRNAYINAEKRKIIADIRLVAERKLIADHTSPRTETIKIYNITQHPERELCFEWIRDNWHDLNNYNILDLIESIKALSKKIGGTCDYSISQYPDRDEYITFKNYDRGILNSLIPDDCPLTGCTWDKDIIEALKDNNTRKILDEVHRQTEYVYSDEALLQHCEANNYEFLKNGAFFGHEYESIIE